jgi:hypothetical protein
MNAGKLDSTIMLLSTDWFLPYWYVIGVGLDEKKKVLFKQGCREIVKQIVSGAKEYWLSNFSDERLQRTYSMLRELIQKCGLERQVTQRILALVGEPGTPHLDEGTEWLLISLTEQLLNNSLEQGRELSPEIKEALAKEWNQGKGSGSEVNLEQLSLASESEWDNYMRGLTPDLPTSLVDYLRSVGVEAKLELLWAVVDAKLTRDQKQELLLWYRRVGRSITGEELVFPLET